MCCTVCRRAHSDAERARGRAIAQERFPVEMRRRFLDALYSGQPFRATVRDLGLTPNQVWGLTRTDDSWRVALDAALTATRRDDLEHGTNAAYVAGCVCRDCREHQRGGRRATSGGCSLLLVPTSRCRRQPRIRITTSRTTRTTKKTMTAISQGRRVLRARR